jgi:hypothetical protein
MSDAGKRRTQVKILVDALDSELAQKDNVLKIDRLFGDQPDVLDAIRRARARGVSASSIARLLSTDEVPVSESSVRTWLQRNPLSTR